MAEALGTSSPSVPEGRAIDLLRAGAFPDWWKFVPVAGKATFVKNWSTRPLTQVECETAYKLGNTYDGLGVVTGKFSGGLIALDIDGPEADERYRVAAGAEYEPYGEERTMAWTSGKPGRRQLLYQVPRAIVGELDKVHTLILRLDGSWVCGSGDAERIRAAAEKGEYQEVVLRFNQCQSVVPGSKHPETKERYRWLHYNSGMVNEAPAWLMDVLRGHRKPQRFLSEEDLETLTSESASTAIPPRQIRGWFFKEEVQAKLRPRFTELIFKHPVFDKYEWKERDGSNPQMMSGCPWHGGQSGTAFQYSVETGCWDCKACGVGGDVLDFVHKVATNNAMAGRPNGTELEGYVTEIATALGYRYPEDLQTQQVKEVPRTHMSEREFLDALIVIHDEERNPAIRLGRMAALAQETGRRMSGKECLAAMDEHHYYETARHKNESQEWWKGLQGMKHTVPNLLMAPSQVLLHADGGLGKTSACMGLATAVGRGKTMTIRGIEVPVRQGVVLWIQNDQNAEKLLRDCQDNGIDPEVDRWFQVIRGFQMNHTHEFVELQRKWKPVLTVVDSIGSCSTKMQIEEKDKAFAHPLYLYGELNGDPDGFPATSIIWIHHDNAKGDVRGTKYLKNAVDEQWHLRELKEQEKDVVRQKGKVSSNCRMVEIKKSRLGRQGDLLVVERDRDFAYSVEDYTPTVRREEGGTGDPEPHTLMLDIVKKAVEAEKEPLTAIEVWGELVGLMAGEGRLAPSKRTVRRHLNRWVEDGMLVLGRKKKVKGADKPAETYSLKLLPRAGCELGVTLSLAPSEPLPTQEKASDSPESVSLAFEDDPAPTDPPKSKCQPEPVSLAFEEQIDCAAVDPREQVPSDSEIRTTRARGRARSEGRLSEYEALVAAFGTSTTGLGVE